MATRPKVTRQDRVEDFLEDTARKTKGNGQNSASYLQINDIVFDIPPQSITIQKRNYHGEAPVLRRSSKVRVKSGYRTIGITINMLFATGDNFLSGREVSMKNWVNRELAPLLIQVRKCPFVSIENEKIRKEISGELTSAQLRGASNIAAVVKYINMTTVAQSFDTITVDLYLEVFNHLPFSYGFYYKHIDREGRVMQSRHPGPLFKKFYQGEQFSRLDDKHAVKRYVNEIRDTDSNTLDIIYKEYTVLDAGEIRRKAIEDKANKAIASMVPPVLNQSLQTLPISTSPNITRPLEPLGPSTPAGASPDLNTPADPTAVRSVITDAQTKRAQPGGDNFQIPEVDPEGDIERIEREAEELRGSGWQVAEGEDEREHILYFRFRRITIESSHLMGPGDLIVEAANAYFETLTPTIPILGQSLPTSQFLGCSDSKIVFTLFAAAEEAPYREDDRTYSAVKSIPVGTSHKLSRLNMILDSAITNAIKFRRYGKNEPIYVRHSISRLLKRQIYDASLEGQSQCWDERTQKLKPFNFNDYLACTPESTSSETVGGMPFCSRYTITLFENYQNPAKGNEFFSYIGNAATVFQAKQNVFRKLIQRVQLKEYKVQGGHAVFQKFFIHPDVERRTRDRNWSSTQLGWAVTDIEAEVGRELAIMFNHTQALVEPGGEVIPLENILTELRFERPKDEIIEQLMKNQSKNFHMISDEVKFHYQSNVTESLDRQRFSGRETEYVKKETKDGTKWVLVVKAIAARPKTIPVREGEDPTKIDIEVGDSAYARLTPYSAEDSNVLYQKFLTYIYDPEGGRESQMMRDIYKSELSEIEAINELPPRTTYPDIMGKIDLTISEMNQLGLQNVSEKDQLVNPDFYFYNYSSDFPQLEKIRKSLTFDSGVRKEVLSAYMKKHVSSGRKTLGDCPNPGIKLATLDDDRGLDPELMCGRKVMFASNVEEVIQARSETLEEFKQLKTRDNKTDTTSPFELTVRGTPLAQDGLTPEGRVRSLALATNFTADEAYNMRRAMPTFKLLVYDELASYSEQDLKSFSDTSPVTIQKSKKGIWRQFTDYYDINSVMDMRVIKSQDNPADILILRIINTKTDIINKQMTKEILSAPDGAYKHNKKLDAGSPDESRMISDLLLHDKKLKDVLFAEGRRVQLRMGYEADPNYLTLEFNGRVMAMSGGDIIEIICQGDGVELVQEIKGVTPNDNIYSYNSNTINLISHLLATSPEVRTLGVTGTMTAAGSVEKTFRGLPGGSSVLDNIFVPDLFTVGEEALEGLTSFVDPSRRGFFDQVWDIVKTGAAMTAIAGATALALYGVAGTIVLGLTVIAGTTMASFAAFFAVFVGAALIFNSIWKSIKTFFKGSAFSVYQMTIWDVLQECTLRHPGIICSVVPYDNRSTIFFGYPDELYFWRGPSYIEALFDKSDSSFYHTTQGEVLRDEKDKTNTGHYGGELIGPGETSNAADKDTLRKALASSAFEAEVKDEMEQIRAGRNQQMGATAIPYSTLRAEAEDRVLRRDQAQKTSQMTMEKLIDSKIQIRKGLNLPAIKTFRDYHIVTSENDIINNDIIVSSEDVSNSIQVMYPTDTWGMDDLDAQEDYKPSYKISADDDLIPAYVKTKHLFYKNAYNGTVQDLPERYAISELCRSMGEVYKGKLIILGRSVKPYDVIFLSDNYNGIYGPIEVKSVAQVFSYQTGWVTEVTPRMIVMPSESPGVAQIQGLKHMAHSLGIRNYSLFINEFGSYETDEAAFLDTRDPMIRAGSKSESGLKTANQIYRAGAGSAYLGAEAAQLFNMTKDGLKALKATTIPPGLWEAAKFTGKIPINALKTALATMRGFLVTMILSIAVDYLISGFVSWATYRQPIIVLPLTRNGKPWYTALYGMKNNTMLGAIEKEVDEITANASVAGHVISRAFSEIAWYWGD